MELIVFKKRVDGLCREQTVGRLLVAFPSGWISSFLFQNFLCLTVSFWNQIEQRAGKHLSKIFK